MTGRELIAPLHKIVEMTRETLKPAKFLAIGDGGNELGMGKVIDAIRNNISKGELIGAVTPADYLITASVSNWGGYALAAAAAVVRHHDMQKMGSSETINDWVDRCLPTEKEEVKQLERCVKAGCRDGVSGK